MQSQTLQQLTTGSSESVNDSKVGAIINHGTSEDNFLELQSSTDTNNSKFNDAVGKEEVQKVTEAIPPKKKMPMGCVVTTNGIMCN